MAYLKNYDTDTQITRYVTLNEQQERTLAKHTALDGTVYLTRFGDPIVTYVLDVAVDFAGKALLLSAADQLNEIEVEVREGVYRGRIESMDNFESPFYGWFTTKIVLSAVSEVGTP